jgi:hypothetical protein
VTQIRNAPRQRQLSADFPQNLGTQYLASVATAVNYAAGREPLILGTGGAPGITITLPSASAPDPANYAKTYYVKKVDAGAGAVTVQRAGADLIDGAVNVALVNQYDSIGLVSDGVGNWHIIEPAGWGGGGVVPPAGYCWLYCVATGTTHGGTGACANITSPGANYNTVLGYQAMEENVTGDENTMVGAWAGRGAVGQSYSWNTGIGYRVLYSLETGAENTASGYECGRSLTSGSYNSFFGGECAYNLTTGDYNWAGGYSAMNHNVTGVQNTVTGYHAGHGSVGDSYSYNSFYGAFAGSTNTTANYNAAFGWSALEQNSTGQYNALFGAEAGEGTPVNSHDGNTGIGYQSIHVISTGSYNFCGGYRAGDIITTGSYNIIIGDDCDPPAAGTNSHINIGDTIYGDRTTDNVGIGVVAGTSTLELYEAAGDPTLTYDIGGVDKFTLGVDDDQGDRFVISDGGVLGANDRVIVDASGYTSVKRLGARDSATWVTPSYPIDAQVLGADTPDRAIYGYLLQSWDAGTKYAAYFTCRNDTNNAGAGNAYGLYSITNFNGTGTVNGLFGIDARARVAGAGNVTTMRAMSFNCSVTTGTAATIGTMEGIYSIVDVEDSTTTTARGLFTRIDVDTGALTTAYGIQIATTPALGIGGAITTAYGLYVGTVDKATTNYAIYTQDGNVRFGDDVLIGATAEPGVNPGYTLTVADNTNDPTPPAGSACFYSKDVAGTVEAFAVDEGGAAAQLTPHDAETGKWIARVRNRDGVWMQVEMEEMMRALDEMLGGGHIKEWRN